MFLTFIQWLIQYSWINGVIINFSFSERMLFFFLILLFFKCENSKVQLFKLLINVYLTALKYAPFFITCQFTI